MNYLYTRITKGNIKRYGPSFKAKIDYITETNLLKKKLFQNQNTNYI